jgi:hypothetical protein
VEREFEGLEAWLRGCNADFFLCDAVDSGTHGDPKPGEVSKHMKPFDRKQDSLLPLDRRRCRICCRTSC